MSKLLGWVFDAVMRAPLARFAEDLARPFAAQEAALRSILARNARTEFGVKHGFAGMADLPGTEMWSRFRRAVPIRPYAEFAPDIERMKNGEENVLIPRRPEMFSLTSGTTSEPKYCPVNRAFIKEHHRQHLLWMYNVYRDHPRVNAGKYLVAASPAEMGRTAGGIPFGAMSGKQLDVQSIPVRRRMAVPPAARRLGGAEARWFSLLLFAAAEEDIRVVTAVNPSTLVAIANRLDRDAERLLECLEKGLPAPDRRAGPEAGRLARRFRPDPRRARRLREAWRVDGTLSPAVVWPGLELLLTWQGGSSSFHLPHVAARWGNTAMRCLGLRASEGTFSIPLRDNTASAALATGGHAMEFAPATEEALRPDQPTLLAGQLEEGGLYRLVVTTSGGFHRYDMGDLVRVTGFNRRTPEVAFERRAGAILSATGEKVTEDQAVLAMAAAAANGPLMNGFSLTWEMDGSVVRYVVAMECAGTGGRAGPGRLRECVRQLLAIFDYEMMNRNCEYQAKREDGRIGYPRAVRLAEGAYERLRASLAAGGRPENQVKQPILIRPERPGDALAAGVKLLGSLEIAGEF